MGNINKIRNVSFLKTISLFGVVGSFFYFLHIISGRLLYKGYNPMAQAISDLTASNAPSRNTALLFSFFYGICTVIFSLGFFFYFKGKINKIITVASFSFFLMAVVSFFGYTFFPLSEAGYAGNFQDKIHVVVTVFVVAFTMIAVILFSIGFFKIKELKYLGIISLITFILLITGAILINLLPAKYFGIAERINIYSVILYTSILSVWMYKKINNERENRRLLNG